MPVLPESIVFPSFRVQEGTTPLLRAAQKGHEVIVGFLLKNGSNVEEQCNVGGPKGVLSSCDCIMLFDGSLGLVSTSSSLDRSVWWPVGHVCSAKADAATSLFWRVIVSCEEDIAGFSSSFS